MRKITLAVWTLALSQALFFSQQALSADFDPNEWFDECPEQLCGAPPTGGVGGGGSGGGPIIVSYDLGPTFALQEDYDADGVVEQQKDAGEHNCRAKSEHKPCQDIPAHIVRTQEMPV